MWPSLPTVICIETIGACNRACWFCKFGQPRGEEKASRMAWELVEQIIGQLAAIDFAGRVSWFRINEPLLDKRLPQIIRLTRNAAPKCFLGLLTNGDLLTSELAGELFQAGLNRLGVSAYDDETYARAPTIPGALVLDRRPATESGFVENRGGNIRGTKSLNYQARGCDRPSTAMNVLTDGRVVLCCADLHGDVIMGDLSRESIAEIWNGERFVTVRQQLAKGRRGLPLCAGCTHDGEGHQRVYPK